mmetsp:Transcript_56272/g.163130  ORF Transcript_56272/g.163130 Transcript_56272/m.163130 type:complete len:208 (+) Transcript_56272:312-935(+)
MKPSLPAPEWEARIPKPTWKLSSTSPGSVFWTPSTSAAPPPQRLWRPSRRQPLRQLRTARKRRDGVPRSRFRRRPLPQEAVLRRRARHARRQQRLLPSRRRPRVSRRSTARRRSKCRQCRHTHPHRRLRASRRRRRPLRRRRVRRCWPFGRTPCRRHGHPCLRDFPASCRRRCLARCRPPRRPSSRLGRRPRARSLAPYRRGHRCRR